jgi:hypothetical protein
VPPDVIALLIIAEHPDKFTRRKLAVDAQFVDELWYAALGDQGGADLDLK